MSVPYHPIYSQVYLENLAQKLMLCKLNAIWCYGPKNERNVTKNKLNQKICGKVEVVEGAITINKLFIHTRTNDTNKNNLNSLRRMVWLELV